MTQRTALGAVAASSAICGLLLVFFPGLFALVVPSLIGIAALLLVVRLLVSDFEARRTVIQWTLLSFLLHVAIGAVIVSSTKLLIYIASDSDTYHRSAVSIVYNWADGLPAFFRTETKRGYPYLLAWTYRAFGIHQIAGVVLNATLSAAIVPIMFDTTKRLFGGEAARRTSLLLVCLPGFLVWPSPLMREAGVLMLLAIVANCGVRLTTRVRMTTLMVVALSIAGIFAFRDYIALVTAGALVLAISFGRPQLYAGMTTGLSIVIFLAILVFGLRLGYSGYQATIETNFRDAQSTRQSFATSANTGFDVNADVSTPGAAVAYLPRALPQFLLGPFPWQIRGVRQLPTLADAFTCLWLVPFVMKGLATGWRRQRRRTLVLLAPAAALAASLSVILGNFGTLVRERPQVLVFLVPLAALGLAERSKANAHAVEIEDPSTTDLMLSVPQRHQ